MQKVILLVVILVIAALGAWWWMDNDQSDMEKTKMMEQQKDTMMKEEKKMLEGEQKEGMMQKSESGRYVEYSKQAFDEAADTRRVLFFYANWCPICRPADSDFRENMSRIPSDVTVIRVNYNDTSTDQEEKDLATKYGVTYQHTFIQIDTNGNQVTKWNGGKLQELLTNIK